MFLSCNLNFLFFPTCATCEDASVWHLDAWHLKNGTGLEKEETKSAATSYRINQVFLAINSSFAVQLTIDIKWPANPNDHQSPMAARAQWPPDPNDHQSPMTTRAQWPPEPNGCQSPMTTRAQWSPCCPHGGVNMWPGVDSTFNHTSSINFANCMWTWLNEWTTLLRTYVCLIYDCVDYTN